MWLPDTYQGAPSPVTGFMGSAESGVSPGELESFLEKLSKLMSFVISWTGWDYVSALTFLTFLLRFLFHQRRSTVAVSFKCATKDTLWFFGGFIFAVATVFLQDILLYQSLSEAFKQRFGSMLARMGSSLTKNVYPYYKTYLEQHFPQFSFGNLPRKYLIKLFWGIFRENISSRSYHIVSWSGIVTIAVALIISIRKKALTQSLVSLLAMVCLITSACIAWFVFMPWHSIFHPHIFRHFNLIFLGGIPCTLLLFQTLAEIPSRLGLRAFHHGIDT